MDPIELHMTLGPAPKKQRRKSPRSAPRNAAALSGVFIIEVRYVYRMLQWRLQQPSWQESDSREFAAALPAILLAATAFEAFVNELTAKLARLKSLAGQRISQEDREAMRLLPSSRSDLKARVRQLLKLVAKYYPLEHTCALSPDLTNLLNIRHALVHYKFLEESPFSAGQLMRMPFAGKHNGKPIGFPQCLENIASIRWAHDTVCRNVKNVLERLPPQIQEQHSSDAVNFTALTE